MEEFIISDIFKTTNLPVTTIYVGDTEITKKKKFKS